MNYKTPHLAVFTTAAIAATAIFPTTNRTNGISNPFAEPVGVIAMKTSNPMISFIGYVAGYGQDIANLSGAQAFDNVMMMQEAFNDFLINNQIKIIVGEHSHGVKRLVDSMFGNGIVGIDFRQDIEVLNLAGTLHSTNPSWNTLDSYAASTPELELPRQNLPTDSIKRIALVYNHLIDRLNEIGFMPTTANVMPYQQRMVA